MMSLMSADIISNLVRKQIEGISLEQAFYKDPGIYQREFERLFMKSWLYVGHTSQLPDVGDYFLYEIDNESVIIVREEKGSIKALLNVCRHRGSRICLESSGHKKLLVCPYHHWTYELDGSLRGASHTPAGFDKVQYSLKQIHLKIFHGMLFINFDEEHASFKAIEQDLDDCLQPYGLENAKVACKKSYPIKANWKLAIENYCECYHCIPSHPEYAEAHGRSWPRAEVAELLKQVLKQGEKAGLSTRLVNKEWLKTGGIGNNRGFDRYPLLKGFVTGSRDGKPLSPLLGDIKEYDGGATDMQIGPLTFFLAYCDHIVIYHFKPLTFDSVDCEITWLINENAVEGKDYTLDELTWLWDITTVADKRIIENNQKGIDSSFYEPGPYTMMEYFARSFIEWYLNIMK